MYADFHVHTNFSHDALNNPKPEATVKGAIAQGVEILCLTDHVEFDYIAKDLSFDVVERNAVLADLQKKYADQIDIRTGAELGLQPHLGEEYRAFMKLAPLDFVIASTHVVDKYPLKTSVYPRFLKLYDQKGGIDRYFQTTLHNIDSFDDFDVYGHLDYIGQYSYGTPVPYKEHADLIDAVLLKLIGLGKGIEINTSGYPGGTCYPNADILKRYRELGGEIITTGSDAHIPQTVGFAMKKAHQELRDCGFRYFTVFKDRKPEFIPL